MPPQDPQNPPFKNRQFCGSRTAESAAPEPPNPPLSYKETSKKEESDIYVPDRERQIALLYYKMQHSAQVTPEEIIGAMSLEHGDGMGGGSKGRISDKTMYIALNYQERMDRINVEAANEIAQRLLKLKAVQDQLRYYVSLLEQREAEVIRLTYFEGIDQDSIAESFGIVPRTMRRIKKAAIEKLAEMYIFTENSMS